MAFKMKGFSPFTQKQDNPGPNSTTDGDEVSGRTQIEEIKHDQIILDRICYITKKKHDKVDVLITNVEIEGQYGETIDRFDDE